MKYKKKYGLFVYLCSLCCGCMFIFIQVNVCLCMWRPEVSVGCCPSGALPLFFLRVISQELNRQAVLTGLRVQQLFISASPSAGIGSMHTAPSVFTQLCGSKSGSYSVTANPLLTELSPQSLAIPPKEFPFENEMVRWITNTIKHKSTNIPAIGRHGLLILTHPCLRCL